MANYNDNVFASKHASKCRLPSQGTDVENVL